MTIRVRRAGDLSTGHASRRNAILLAACIVLAVGSGTIRASSSIERAAELAGFFAAHAVWSVSDGETLIPLVGFESPDGKRQMTRIIAERLEEGAARGKDWLARNQVGAARAVLVFDGYITVGTEKTDALHITIRDYAQRDVEITIAVPYRPARHAGGFAIHRLKLLGVKGAEADRDSIIAAFRAGIAKHEQGSKIWNRFLDESR